MFGNLYYLCVWQFILFVCLFSNRRFPAPKISNWFKDGFEGETRLIPMINWRWDIYWLSPRLNMWKMAKRQNVAKTTKVDVKQKSKFQIKFFRLGQELKMHMVVVGSKWMQSTNSVQTLTEGIFVKLCAFVFTRIFENIFSI